MEFSTSTPSSIFTPKLFFKTSQKPNSKFSISHSKFIQFPLRFRFCVHSRQPTRRPNYLRRKLIDPFPQVRQYDNVVEVGTDKLVKERSNFDSNLVKTDGLVEELSNFDSNFDDLVEKNSNFDSRLARIDDLVAERSNLGYNLVKTGSLAQEKSSLDYNLVKSDDLVEERSNFDYDLVKDDNLVEERSNFDNDVGIDKDDKGLVAKDKILGDSNLLNKLESWVELCKAETEYWGFGTGHVFTVFEDSDGKVERVEVNEDEIWKRSGRKAVAFRDDDEGEGGIDVRAKILYAKQLARETENGNNLIARDSPISRYVVSGSKSGFVDVVLHRTSGFVNAIPHNFQWSGIFPKVKRIGFMLMIGLILVEVVKKLFIEGENGEENPTTVEKEMLRRKLKARAEKGEIKKGTVEVIHTDVERENEPMERPGLDKEELMKEIMKAKGFNNEHSKQLSTTNSMSDEFSNKIQEIKMMARHAREIEKRDAAARKNDEDARTDNLMDKNEVSQLNGNGHGHGHGHSSETFSNGNTRQIEVVDTIGIGISSDDAVKNGEDLDSTSSNSSLDIGNRDKGLHSTKASLVDQQPTKQGGNLDERSPTKKLRVIRSVKEARDYLSRKGVKQDADQEIRSRGSESVDVVENTSEMEAAELMGQQFKKVGNHIDSSSGRPNYVLSSESHRGEDGGGEQIGGSDESMMFSAHEGSLSDQQSETPVSILSGEKGTNENTGHEKEEEVKLSQSHSISESVGNLESNDLISIQDENNYSQNAEGEKNKIDVAGHEQSNTNAGLSPLPKMENWVEKNFHELEPIIKKMGEGFRGNYMVAKEKTKDYNSEDITLLPKSEGDSGELSWMKDEKLRDIVFRVRDNELAGREPFHQIDNESKLAFFNGLENKVEEENKRLLNLHEYLHSNIENLDYGTDGISMYDPLEKVVPRWKGPPIEKPPSFLNENINDKIPGVGENIIKPQAQNSSKLPSGISTHDSSSAAPLAIDDLSSRVKKGIPKSPKTIIEGSDGTTKVGKKSGKEFWQHTKKWSEGFLKSYNEETNPEVKAVMKDIGKDLDRWITEKEIKEAAELMDKLPEKGQKFVKSKLDKVKREMELFGPQAVVSKYREYADVKEEDFLWWLDLPCVLCIELYMKEEGEQRVGLYSLEMAPDLELDPKPNHVIAFEDAGDCKSFCYIIQHHLELIGNGNAFVIARQPKDAFREAKESGFSVTVIRKGELQLNVDQTLEEIEELIIEIGSKVYHDKIMQERSVDMSGFMKGIFGTSKPSRRRRSKKRLKKPNRH